MSKLSLFLNPKKGQGLVEYAIILALVAIVVIAVMRLMGPKIGNTFSSINNSLEVGAGVSGPPAPSGSFVFVANEGGTFNVPAGLFEVQYGANGTFFTQFVNGPLTMSCTNGTFGDPLPGVVKSCAMR
jgi:pilus assembly protein Flp/PilA